MAAASSNEANRLKFIAQPDDAGNSALREGKAPPDQDARFTVRHNDPSILEPAGVCEDGFPNP
jgi:hypothetical protein